MRTQGSWRVVQSLYTVAVETPSCLATSRIVTKPCSTGAANGLQNGAPKILNANRTIENRQHLPRLANAYMALQTREFARGLQQGCSCFVVLEVPSLAETSQSHGAIENIRDAASVIREGDGANDIASDREHIRRPADEICDDEPDASIADGLRVVTLLL